MLVAQPRGSDAHIGPAALEVDLSGLLRQTRRRGGAQRACGNQQTERNKPKTLCRCDRLEHAFILLERSQDSSKISRWRTAAALNLRCVKSSPRGFAQHRWVVAGDLACHRIAASGYCESHNSRGSQNRCCRKRRFGLIMRRTDGLGRTDCPRLLRKVRARGERGQMRKRQPWKATLRCVDSWASP